jgi:hypothetical protein
VTIFQVVEDGYEFFAGRELVTLFSAPNYCGEFDNAAAIMIVDESLVCSFKVVNKSYVEFISYNLFAYVADLEAPVISPRKYKF